MLDTEAIATETAPTEPPCPKCGRGFDPRFKRCFCGYTVPEESITETAPVQSAEDKLAARMAVLKTLQPGDIVVAEGERMLPTVHFITGIPDEYDLCGVAGDISLFEGKLSHVKIGGYASLVLLAEQTTLRILRNGEGAI
jgi:hypothetical protein